MELAESGKPPTCPSLGGEGVGGNACPGETIGLPLLADGQSLFKFVTDVFILSGGNS